MESDMDDVGAIAEQINEILANWGLDHQLEAHGVRCGDVDYILIVDGGRPDIYIEPQTVLTLLTHRRARGHITAPDVWNVLAAYRRNHFRCTQDALGRWCLHGPSDAAG
jgi:hypothetical protein